MIHAEESEVVMNGNGLVIFCEFQCICASMCDAGYSVEHLHECVESGFEAWQKMKNSRKDKAMKLIKKVDKDAQKNKSHKHS